MNIETLNVEGKYKVFTETGRQTSKYELFDWIKIIQDLGAGEIVITSIKNEGRKNGFDISLYEKSSKLVNIPLIAHGGAGNSNHIIDLFKKTDVDGVLLASILHYDKIISLSGKKNTGNFSFLNENLNNAKKEKGRSSLIIKNQIRIKCCGNKNKNMKKKPLVAIVNTSACNLLSVLYACKSNQINTKVIREYENPSSYDGIIFPGVGNFGFVSNLIFKNQLDKFIKHFIEKDKPGLFICLGMQILFESSEENEKSKGLSFFKGQVKKIKKCFTN